MPRRDTRVHEIRDELDQCVTLVDLKTWEAKYGSYKAISGLVKEMRARFAAPFFAIALVQAYKWISIRYLGKTKEACKTMVLTAHSGLFSLLTVFYLKTDKGILPCPRLGQCLMPMAFSGDEA